MLIRLAHAADLDFIRAELRRHWGGVDISSRGKWFKADALPALVAEIDGSPAGLLTYVIEAGECEVITLSSVVESRGVGAALLERAVQIAREDRCRRVFLTTTNDNLRAIGFYQRRGWTFCALHRNAMDVARRAKPDIPATGLNGIPLRDELELEIKLDAAPLSKRDRVSKSEPES